MEGSARNKVTNRERTYVLESEIANAVSDDLIVARPENQRYFFMFGNPNALMKKIGVYFMLDEQQKRFTCMMVALDVEWQDNMSIMLFISKFIQLLKLCCN